MSGGWWVTVRTDPPFAVCFAESARTPGRLDAVAVRVTGGHDGREWIDTTTLRRVDLAGTVAWANRLDVAARIRAGEAMVHERWVPL
jgi:hypothetical protein